METWTGGAATIYRVAVLSAVLLAGMGRAIPAYAGASDVQVVNGKFDSSSHTAEGPSVVTWQSGRPGFTAIWLSSRFWTSVKVI
jgi:hypothetical protein